MMRSAITRSTDCQPLERIQSDCRMHCFRAADSPNDHESFREGSRGGLETHEVESRRHTIGLSVKIPGRSVAPGSDLAPKGMRGYAALFKRWEHWTPYVSYAFLRSPRPQTDFYTALNDNTLPAFVPGAAQLTLAQRAGADQIQASRQHSWAVGTAYSFSATQKVKAEYLHTRIGEVSRLVDPLPGTTVRNASINVLSLSYSMVF